ncbi:DUF6170 family protein [Thalassotalea fusca]
MSHFSSKQFEALDKFTFKERQQIIVIAQAQLTVPEKLILNLFKLVLIIPLFWMLATHNWLGFIVALVVVLAIYIAILRPLNLKFLSKYIEEAVSKHCHESSQ